ncbi:hypothetical protein QL104_25720 [Pseudomonas piscis]|uniref:MFS transporter n=1 Tax=Pseudomonas piscis TaxID=2614538 RepID=A0ABY9NEB2_9PSED|nr:hypothetical protein [Pseudomonas piscis]WMN16716.1 hypothetical protein QL104_25720 [Pseudomonas piscis]
MINILQGTPLWVYAVFAMILYYGLRARFGSRESLGSLLIGPLILLVWSLWSMSLGGHPLLALGAWTAGAVLGSLVAMLLFSTFGAVLDSGRAAAGFTVGLFWGRALKLYRHLRILQARH